MGKLRKNMRTIKLINLHILLPIIVGGLIYLSFRNTTLNMFRWFELMSLSSLIYSLREILYPISLFLPEWIIYSLPDGLWVYSFSSSFIIIWYGNFDTAKPWLLFPLLLGAFAEVLQYFNILPGTFDLIDFFFCIIASILSILFVKPKIKKNEKEIF